LTFWKSRVISRRLGALQQVRKDDPICGKTKTKLKGISAVEGRVSRGEEGRERENIDNKEYTRTRNTQGQGIHYEYGISDVEGTT